MKRPQFHSIDLDENTLAMLVSIFSAGTMFIRVELDFKRNAFRVVGHSIAAILVILTIFSYFSIIQINLLLEWLLLSVIFLLINEVIRIYLRKHSMNDILENHATLYWLTRGKLRRKSPVKNVERK